MRTAVLGSLIGIAIYSIGLVVGFIARWRLGPEAMTYSHHDGKETPMNHYNDTRRHTISMTDPPSLAVKWLTARGARAGYVGDGQDGLGIVFDNGPGTPTHIALPGDTLIHNPNGIITVT